MTKIKVKKLVWTEWTIEHIKKHNISVEEIIVAVKNLAYHKQTYNNRYLVIGRSGPRIISVVVRRKALTAYLVITARDANKKERRRLYEKEKKQNS